MQRLKDRKFPIFSLIGLVAIGTFFGIRIFTSASNPQTSNLRETQTIQELSTNFSSTKIGTIKEPEEIIIYAEANGIIQSIKTNEGDNIRGGQPIIQIQDNLEIYTQQLESAKNIQESTQELYEKTQTNFQEQIQKAESEITLLQKELSLTEHELQQINAIAPNIKEIKLQEQIQTLTNTKEQIKNSIQQSLQLGEQIKNSLSRELQSTYTTQFQQLKKKQNNQTFTELTQENILTEFENSEKNLTEIINFLETIQQSLNKETLSEPEQQTKTELDLLYISCKQQQQNILQQKNLCSEIISTDYQSQKQQQLQETEAKLLQLEQNLEQTKLNLQLLKTNSTSQLEELTYNLQTARTNYEKIYNEFNKLTSRATIAGTLKTIFVTQGEQIREGDPLFSIIQQTEQTQIELGLTLEEYLSTIGINEIQLTAKNIEGDWITTTGTISFRSPVANEEGIYMLTIESLEKLDETFSRIQIDFPINSEFFFLPKENIEIKNQSEGYLYILNEEEMDRIQVPLGIHRNEYIEIKKMLNTSTQIITNFRQ